MQFELVKDYQDELNLLPTRATKGSAGYDFRAAKDYHIVDNDITTSMRMGDFGSTCKK